MNETSGGSRPMRGERRVAFDPALLRQLQEGANKTCGVLGRGAEQRDVEEFERLTGIRVPEEFRQFLRTVNGCIIPGRMRVLGLAPLAEHSGCLEEAIALLRFGFSLKPDLLPIEDLGGGLWAFLHCGASDFGFVEEFAVSAGEIEVGGGRRYRSFYAYCWGRLNRPPDWEAIGRRNLKEHIARFHEEHGYSHNGKGKLPRNHVWRPYRFCIQDVVFGSTVVRHSRELNCLEVDVFLTAEIQGYDSLAGATALARFILSEAWKCGGTMEVRFTNLVEGGHVPAALRKVGERHGVILSGDRLKPDQAKALYAVLTGFSASGLARLQALEKFERMTVAQACYLVHQNLWTVTQVEFLLGSEIPEVSLRGLALPGQRLLWNYGLQRARGAGLAALLVRALAKRSAVPGGNRITELEDDVLPVRISIIAASDAIEITADEALTLPWSAKGECVLAPRQRAWVFVRPWDASELPCLEGIVPELDLGADLHAVLVAKDFESLPDDVQARCLDSADHLGVSILVAPETSEGLDSDSASKMARSRLLRK